MNVQHNYKILTTVDNTYVQKCEINLLLIYDTVKCLLLGLAAETLALAYQARADTRSSDVRLDLGIIFRPLAWPRVSISPDRWLWRVVRRLRFERTDHINVLELKAVLGTLKWRMRSSRMIWRRYLHMVDSQVTLGVVAKGRSSSRMLMRILKKINALTLAGSAHHCLVFVRSEANPADAPSRWESAGW